MGPCAVASFPRNYSYHSGDRRHYRWQEGTRGWEPGKIKKEVGRYRETGKGRTVNRSKGDKFFIVV